MGEVANIRESEAGGQPSSTSRQIEKRNDRMFGWFHPHSAIRRAAHEVRNLPRRILANRELPNWGWYRLPPTPQGLPPNMFRQSCSEGIAKLREEYPWLGDLDSQILARAYAAGAAWVIGNFGTGKSKGS